MWFACLRAVYSPKKEDSNKYAPEKKYAVKEIDFEEKLRGEKHAKERKTP